MLRHRSGIDSHWLSEDVVFLQKILDRVPVELEMSQEETNRYFDIVLGEWRDRPVSRMVRAYREIVYRRAYELHKLEGDVS